MKIMYSATPFDHDLKIDIVPESPFNGFYGVSILVKDAPLENVDAFVTDRVKWKLTQELGGLTVDQCELVRV